MEIKTECKVAVALYGAEHQIDKAIEEMGELTTALIQYRDKRINKGEVLTEIADVRIMMEQLTEIFGHAEADVVYKKKVDRLSATIQRKFEEDRVHDSKILERVRHLSYINAPMRDEFIDACRTKAAKDEIERIYLQIREELLGE